tara:strand:- start:49 stop:375 length:327 start_codon:yes stop_codon:yes gene_type:complete
MYKDYEIKLNAILDKHKGVQKVELGLVQDVLSLYDKIEGFKNEMDKNLSKAKSSAIKVDAEIKNFKKLAGNVEKAAKDLGISVNDLNLKKLYSDINTFEKDADAVIEA